MMKIPRKEHPRPQMQRDTWETLNGSWEFAFDFSKSGIDRELWYRSARRADCQESDLQILYRLSGTEELFR